MSKDLFRQTKGGLIDRSQTISFQFNGTTYQGYSGDSLASALIANGVYLTARSFKYHRPRGIVGSGYEEPSSLVELIGDEESGNQPITRVQIDGYESVHQQTNSSRILLQNF
jgi:sarcosine oxidase subunit alpha